MRKSPWRAPNNQAAPYTNVEPLGTREPDQRSNARVGYPHPIADLQHLGQQIRRYRFWRQARLFGLTGLAGFAAAVAFVWYEGEQYLHRAASGLPALRAEAPVITTHSAGPFRSCRQARAEGFSSMRRGDPGYAPHLDADNDGIACEPYWRW
ncbi:MAG TPA: excalibur calcium-binding domain-containing protein [Microvirga sp.]|jgi:hypothetical protein